MKSGRKLPSNVVPVPRVLGDADLLGISGGTIKGECTEKTHKDWIMVLSYSGKSSDDGRTLSEFWRSLS